MITLTEEDRLIFRARIRSFADRTAQSYHFADYYSLLGIRNRERLIPRDGSIVRQITTIETVRRESEAFSIEI